MPRIVKQSLNDGKVLSRGSVFDRIKPIGFDPDDGIKVMLYGQSGSGKTTVWATFPKPILSIICSGGNQPGELRSIDTREYKDVIRTVTLHKSSEVRELAEGVADGYPHEDGTPYKTIVLDHASGLQDMVLKEVLGLEELPAQKSWGMASQQLYGQCTGACKDLFRKMLNLRCNVVIVAQERETKDEDNSDIITPTVGAGLTPSLAGWLNQAVDYICQTFKRPREVRKVSTIGQGKAAKQIETWVKTKEIEYCLRTGPHQIYTTKFRVPKGSELPDAIVDPSYDKLISVIRGATGVRE